MNEEFYDSLEKGLRARFTAIAVARQRATGATKSSFDAVVVDHIIKRYFQEVRETIRETEAASGRGNQ